MKGIILGAALVMSLSACGTSNTTDPETLDVSGVITEKEFETGSSSCTMAFKAPGKPAPAPAKPAPAKPAVVAPKPATGGVGTKAGSTGYRPAQGPIPTKSYKSGSYKVYPILGGSNRCYKSDCWEIEFRTSDGEEFDVCVTKGVYDSYRVGDTFPKEG